jgi:hypothetical protein
MVLRLSSLDKFGREGSTSFRESLESLEKSNSEVTMRKLLELQDAWRREDYKALMMLLKELDPSGEKVRQDASLESDTKDGELVTTTLQEVREELHSVWKARLERPIGSLCAPTAARSGYRSVEKRVETGGYSSPDFEETKDGVGSRRGEYVGRAARRKGL